MVILDECPNPRLGAGTTASPCVPTSRFSSEREDDESAWKPSQAARPVFPFCTWTHSKPMIQLNISADVKVDIPKLEQLIVSRLRAVIQDRLVDPNHLALALPQFLSSSVSPTPIINDIGESAVTAMGDAVKKGFSQMVEDLRGGVISQTDGESYTSHDQLVSHDHSTTPGISRRRITMPAGFPHTAYASSSSTTSLQTPGQPNGLRYPTTQPSEPPRQSPPLPASSSAHRIQPGQNGRTSTSTIPSSSGQSQSQFRFRGQFASQPGTPGPGNGLDMHSGTEARQFGALNARAR